MGVILLSNLELDIQYSLYDPNHTKVYIYLTHMWTYVYFSEFFTYFTYIARVLEVNITVMPNPS